jgi:hypothetical protein
VRRCGSQAAVADEAGRDVPPAVVGGELRNVTVRVANGGYAERMRSRVVLFVVALLTLLPADALARAGGGSAGFRGRSPGSGGGRGFGGGHHFFFFGGGGGGGFLLIIMIFLVVLFVMSRTRRRRGA